MFYLTRLITVFSFLAMCFFGYILWQIELSIDEHQLALSHYEPLKFRMGKFCAKHSLRPFLPYLKASQDLGGDLKRYSFHLESMKASDLEVFDILHRLNKTGLFLPTHLSVMRKDGKIHTKLLGDWLVCPLKD